MRNHGGPERRIMAEERERSRAGAALWLIATLLMLLAAAYQRRTGPTYPVRGEVETAAGTVRYELPRTGETTGAVRLALPRPDPEATASLSYRRYPTTESFTTVPMQLASTGSGPELEGLIPVEPAAGKVEYYVELDTRSGSVRIPEAGAAEPTIILRYKDPVPIAVLIAHIAVMFFTVLIGMRAGLGALLSPAGVRRLSWVTLGGMTVGGMILGPVVQKHAFGAYWTGVPWGWDLTDNKTLIMWVVWIGAVLVLGRRAKGVTSTGRLAVVAAAIVMTVVYVIPHSLRGSELDYGAVEAGVPATNAVETGRR
jgi:hypothetical protein